MMGQRADGDEVDTRLSVLAEGLLGDATGGFRLIFSFDAFHCLAEGDGVEIVEHDTVDATVVEDALQLVEVTHLDLDAKVFSLSFQVVAGTVDGRLNAAGEVDMIILEHHHVVEADAVVGAAAASDGVLLEETHVGRRLAGVEELGIEALEHGDHTAGLGGDAGEALHEVQGCALGGEDGARRTLDGHHNLALEDSIPVVFQKIHSQIIINYLKHPFAHFGATKDAILFGHHLGRALGRGRDAGERGVVAIADILAECHFD